MKMVCDNWKKSNPDIIQIFGHRNIEDTPIKVNSCCYNLEGSVEFGGYLRMITVSKDLPIEEKTNKEQCCCNWRKYD